jgi:hypothetical protein
MSLDSIPVRKRGGSSLPQACWASEQGWSVAPVSVGSKIPVVKWGAIKYRTVEELRREWPSEPTDVAILCGPSDLVVIDVDMPNGEESFDRLMDGYSVPDTMEIRSPSGGRHLVFKAGGQKFVKHRFDDDLDVQGFGGIIILTGPGREISNLCSPLLIPSWLGERLRAKERPAASSQNGNGNGHSADSDLVDMIRNGIPKGMGNGISGSFSMSMVNGPSDELIEELWIKAFGQDSKREREKHRGEIARARAKVQREKSSNFDDENSPEPEQFIDFRNLDQIPDPKPLVKGWLDLGTVVTVAGETGSYKTFAMLDLALAIATGGKWLDKYPIETGAMPVMYVVGEGGYGLKLRGHVWEGQNERVPESMVTFWMRPKRTMAGMNFWESLQEEAIEREAKVIFLDTLSSLAPDIDEAKDAALLVRRCTQLSAATGATVIIIHHSGWGDKGRVRGGSALEFNVDTVIILAKMADSEYREIWLKKSKDGPCNERINVELIPTNGSGYLKTADYDLKVNRKERDLETEETKKEREREYGRERARRFREKQQKNRDSNA